MDGTVARELLSQPAEFLADVLDGLSRPRKALPGKHAHDRRGAELFAPLAARHPILTERILLRRHGAAVARHAGPRATLLALGIGAGALAPPLLDALESPDLYIPVDAVRDRVLEHAMAMAARHPALTLVPIAADPLHGFPLPVSVTPERTLALLSGAVAGDLPVGDTAFLRGLGRRLGRGARLLAGCGLPCAPALLEAAFADPQGAAAAFNRNLLARINRELAGTFDLWAFDHALRVDARAGRVEMQLRSLRDQAAAVAGTPFRFAAGETIRTGVWRTRTVADFRKRAAAAGWHPLECWTDERALFSLHLMVWDGKA